MTHLRTSWDQHSTDQHSRTNGDASARQGTEASRPNWDSGRRQQLEHHIQHAAHFLPSQGPITGFVHHNTLHAFEDLNFEQAVVQAGRMFGCQPYLPEDEYRKCLATGRIQPADLMAVVQKDLKDRWSDSIAGLCTRGQLRLAMLQYSIHVGTDAELRWFVAESDALRHFRADLTPADCQQLVDDTRHWVMRDLRGGASGGDQASGDAGHSAIRNQLSDLFGQFGEQSIERWSDAVWKSFTLQCLWRACRRGTTIRRELSREAVAREPQNASSVNPVAPLALRPRDLLLQCTGEDADRLVHTVLVRITAAFLDQGFARWPMPERDNGLFRAFLNLYQRAGGPLDAWLRPLRAELARIEAAQMGPLESILASLDALGVPADQEEAFITSSLLALRGWAGMIWQLETRPERAVVAAPPGSLIEFLAVRLILDRLAAMHIARSTLGYTGSLDRLSHVLGPQRPAAAGPSSDRETFILFQVAQALGWRPADLFRLTGDQWVEVLSEIEAFDEIERRRLLHRAYERRFLRASLDAFALRARRESIPHASASEAREVSEASEPARFQLVCCLDEREESFRRHLEEIAPDCETLGAAGFYGVAMFYRGAADAHYTPLCPIIIRPEHYVQEEVAYTFEETHQRRTRNRRLLGAALHQLHVRSRSFASGALLSALLGPLATVPLVARVLFPRLTARIRRTAGRLVQTPPVTRLVLERTADNPGPGPGQIGYTVTEMAAIVERQLQDVGLVSRLSRLVIICGHGSSSLNNPHESAHDCGACAGGRGGPNARAFAQMANDPRVRALLAGRGLVIPPTTFFVGAYHNTCDDSVTYFDLDRLSPSHREDFVHARRMIDRARQASAHERCRRFESAPLGLSTEAALRHVEGRAEDLAQTRPEYGHATNAISIVGRRSRTRGLFLDRRAFLTSYDPTQDPDHSILLRNLQAVIPVCAGISLEYYFSFTDPTGYGCGTKLPHNVASLVGVMNGAASDLRPGLPWQMVEIHEPVRQLFLIETTPAAMLQIMEKNESIGTLCRNDWFYLATLDPHSDQIHLLRNGRFEPYQPDTDQLPSAESSLAWYRGWRDHLGYALIGASSDNTAGNHGA